jgi:lipoic acid synthetase
VPASDIRHKRPPLPVWFKNNLPEAGQGTKTLARITTAVVGNALHTVCEEAKCPNINSCWSRGTATFMIAGQSCTRNCRFCSVQHEHQPPPPETNEPERLADAIEQMKLDYAVITVVNRDDLDDGGAAHYRACLDAVHTRIPTIGLELLCSDLNGNETALAALLDGAPLKVFAHNIETVERLSANIRDRKASFATSLRILEKSKELRPDLLTKSSIMVGLGETESDMLAAMKSLRGAGVELLTIGQYLAPTATHYPILSFPNPNQFARWEKSALELGFLAVASGPLVRSSFRAGDLYREAIEKR